MCDAIYEEKEQVCVDLYIFMTNFIDTDSLTRKLTLKLTFNFLKTIQRLNTATNHNSFHYFI